LVPCVIYGGIRQFIFSRSYGFQKLGLHPNAHTVEIDLEKGKSFNAILQDIKFT
jgi:large subunit ribosomal protein L25